MKKLIPAFSALSVTWKAAVLAALLLFGFLVYNFVDDFFSATDEKRAKVAENQGEAAIESGQDAVNSTSTQYVTEIERTNTTERVIERVQESKDFTTSHSIGAQRLCDNAGICSEDSVQPTSR